MKALLLLGGKSKRFWPLKEKPLFPICGKALLTHQIERLLKGGIHDIAFVGSKDNIETISSLYPEYTTFTQDPSLPGMSGALMSALPHIADEPLLIVGGNDFFDPSAFKSLISAFQGNDGALLAQRVSHYFPGGYLDISNNKIVGIVEKPGEGNEPSDFVNIVAHVHNSPNLLLSTLKKQDLQSDDAYEKALDTLFSSHTFVPALYEGDWQAVKYPWHLLDLLPLLLKEQTEPFIHPSATIHESAVIDGPVYISEGCKVFAHATLKGPCYIGPKSIVANNALLRNSSLGENCIVGYATEIKESACCNNVWTHMTYIGDSIIGENVSFGAGSITGNLRLDEKEVLSMVSGEKVSTHRSKCGLVVGENCRFGIHVSTNPGIKVGGGSFVATASTIGEDVPANSFVCMKGGEMVVRENTADVPGMERREEFKGKIGG